MTAVAGLAAALLVPVGLIAAAAPATAAIGECPPGTIPGPGNDNPVFTDNNVAVYAGQDFTALPSSAEVEGLLIVAGSAIFAPANGTFNVGWVGVGSGVAPSPGEVMMAVGGDLTVGAGTVLDVGANAIDGGELLGGNVQVGGTTTPDYETDGSRYRLNNGTLTQGMGADALANWTTWGADISSASAGYAALPPTGTTTAAFGRLTLTAVDGSDPQVFSVSGAVLQTTPEIDFVNLSDDVPVIINVTGSAPVTWAPNIFMEDGDAVNRVDALDSPRFGPVSQRTLWNFTQTTSLHVAGSSQVLGSILVPGVNPVAGDPTLRVTASTNGRLYTNGSIVMDGVGNEHHNYPFIDAPFECIPVPGPPILQTGSIEIAKELSPEDAALLPEDTTFQGTVTCVDPENGVTIAEWVVEPGQTVAVDGLPVGAECVVTEHLGPGSRQFAQPVSGPRADPASRFVWDAPTWEPAPPVFVVEEGTTPQATFTVTNSIARGAFTIVKTVTGEGAPDISFSGTWECAVGDDTTDSGTWQLAAGQTSEPIEAPVGATCTVSETAPVAPGEGLWETPVISPESIVITLDSLETPLEIVVANTFVPVAQLGAFTITKLVENPDGVAFDNTFEGAWQCSTPDGSRELTAGTWTLVAGETTEPIPAPIGAVCSVSEVQPTDPAGGVWGEPELSPASLVITAGSAQQPLVFTVTNTLEGDVPATEGGFEIVKTVVDASGIGYEDSFTGTYQCALDGETVASGTWTASTTSPFTVDGLPIGAECDIAETTPQDPAGGAWSEPVITPASFAIDGETRVAVTVTNTLHAVTPTPGPTPPGPLPATGTTVPWWALALGGGLLLAGAAVTTMAVVRRRRS